VLHKESFTVFRLVWYL